MSAVPPLPIRRLRAEMQLKNLSLKDVSTLSGVGYAVCSQILNGRLIHPENLRLIRVAIKKAPLPMEVTA